MTRMLYTGFVMNKHPNIPDEIFLGGSKEYSWRTDLKVNGWLMVAVLMSSASDFFFTHEMKQLGVAWRTLIALVPFIAILFWVRSLTQWIRGMDELHVASRWRRFCLPSARHFSLLWPGIAWKQWDSLKRFVPAARAGTSAPSAMCLC